MEKEVITNFKHEQDLKMNEYYDQIWGRYLQRHCMDECLLQRLKNKPQVRNFDNGKEEKWTAAINDNTGEDLCPLNKKKNSLCLMSERAA